MPFGEFPYSVDDKGRVIIPPSFREFVEDGMVVTRGLEKCLYVFPMPNWRRIEARLTEMPLTDMDVRRFTRYFYSGASRATIDAAGRITLPQSLRAHADIGEASNSVVIAGAPNRLEIWNEGRWTAGLSDIEAHPPAPELLSELVG